MQAQELREAVLEANLELVNRGLVTYTWGNVSGFDRDAGLVAIKPSGVSYSQMRATDIVLVDLEGSTVDSELRPSSDTPTHIEMYKAFPEIGGIAHSHSASATSFAQARKGLPCFGTTHADHFRGEVPITRMLTSSEVETAYEANTGKLIVETFEETSPHAIPGVLVAGHGPFTWGPSSAEAVKNSAVLEQLCLMALNTVALSPDQTSLPEYVISKHYDRKHGSSAYYGQK